MDAMVGPDVVLATNTSVMSITEIASTSKGRDRIVGTHWWNPPTLLPLVEVVRTEHLSEWVIDLTMALMRKIGKRPVLVQKDVPGFVANRLQHALWRECVSIVEKGIADAATVDEAIKGSFGLRLAALAPMENADMGGLDLTLAIHRYVFPFLEDSHAPSPLLEEKVAKGELGFKTGGKGFQEWTPEQMQGVRDRLLDYLARVAASSK
jgi:3-hydroxybutyryl-CoA dehydrogenase